MILPRVHSASEMVIDLGLDRDGSYTVEAHQAMRPLAGVMDKIKENPAGTLLLLGASAILASLIYDEIRGARPLAKKKRGARFPHALMQKSRAAR